MGVIAETANRVAVMYSGRIVEIGPVAEVLHNPKHPYTKGLMAAIPDMNEATEFCIKLTARCLTSPIFRPAVLSTIVAE